MKQCTHYSDNDVVKFTTWMKATSPYWVCYSVLVKMYNVCLSSHVDVCICYPCISRAIGVDSGNSFNYRQRLNERLMILINNNALLKQLLFQNSHLQLFTYAPLILVWTEERVTREITLTPATVCWVT